MVKIKGWLETSLIDWDGKIASVIFLPGCNFLCPFCHNYGLVRDPDQLPTIPFSSIKKFLLAHKVWIDGVCITGGEPTIHADLWDLIKGIRDLGFGVKLDTNGTNPVMLKELLGKGVLDYVAMDIKTSFEKYGMVGGGQYIREVDESITTLMSSGIEYEFRTTVVPTIVDEDGEDVATIARRIKGARLYVLQQFNPAHTPPPFSEMKPYPEERLADMAQVAAKYVQTKIRGSGARH